jgi:single-strand selective monofunctional uracil DNA glycosylase
LTSYGAGPKRVIFLGMNPGPFGMVQTGIPFGEVAAVRDWMKLKGSVGKPALEHAKRPVLGLACPRSEVSGQRLWGLFARRHPEAESFFADHFVVNFCPLAFVEKTGRNLTPDKLPSAEAAPLLAACQRHLRTVVEVLKPEWVIAVGDFAEAQARRALHDLPVKIGKILHPSPASPLANRDWAGAVTRRLIDLGIWKR